MALGKIDGYCLVNIDADVMSTLGAKAFQGKVVRCEEINEGTKSILALSNCGKGLGMFDFKDTKFRFRCSQLDGWITPPDLDHIERMGYVAALIQNVPRKDKDLVTKMVISHSLSKGEFCSIVYDRILQPQKK